MQEGGKKGKEEEKEGEQGQNDDVTKSKINLHLSPSLSLKYFVSINSRFKRCRLAGIGSLECYEAPVGPRSGIEDKKKTRHGIEQTTDSVNEIEKKSTLSFYQAA